VSARAKNNLFHNFTPDSFVSSLLFSYIYLLFFFLFLFSSFSSLLYKYLDKHESTLYAFFWVIPLRLNFICRRFGTLCLFHRHRRVGMKMEWRMFEVTNKTTSLNDSTKKNIVPAYTQVVIIHTICLTHKWSLYIPPALRTTGHSTHHILR